MNTETTEHTSAAAAPEPAPASLGQSPGTMIREARQAGRLSVDDLAAHTKLARATVEALERDDFGALLEPVYVRGYYRKCAKVLNLNEQKLIDAYAARVTQKAPQPPAKLRLASGTELGSSSRLPVAMGTLAVIVAIVVCAFLWWVRGATTAVPTVFQMQNSSESAPAGVSVTVPAASVTEPVVSGPAGEGASAPAGDIVAPPAPAVEPAAPAPEATAPAAGAGAVPATPAPAAANPTVATAATAAPLRLSFSGQSWIRVSDADGRSLLNGLVAAGERHQLSGKPPFELFIGAAPVVSVEYLGKPVDLKPYTRDNATARVTLPPPSP
ncbi:RodZ domain-containing protein [Solimonas variicoloris]|uniref:RodZ domain-containing protein n=1 Tax=Solimonas variicoloris TaxID=254408 RepID=UPI000A0221FD|nr:RodZ domain-containing protein [Solimonas variicoloris]